MYVSQLRLRDFRGIAKSDIDFIHPDRSLTNRPEMTNVNVLIGHNGGGKSTILKAIVAVLHADDLDSLTGSSFSHWPRIGSDGECIASGQFVEHNDDVRTTEALGGDITEDRMTTGREYSVSLTIPRDQAKAECPVPAPSQGFLAAYGSARTGSSTITEGEDHRLDSVASLFDRAAPLLKLSEIAEVNDDLLRIVHELLPPDVELPDELAKLGRHYIHRGIEIPLDALSDGLQSYLAWTNDLIVRLRRTSAEAIAEVNGVVVVDEVDQRMHPRWQRKIVPQLSRALPRLQFILAAHSPIVAGGLRPENLIALEEDIDQDGDGAMRAVRLREDIYGHTADQVLQSAYFGLDTSRGDDFRSELRDLARRARAGDRDASVEHLRRLSDPLGTSPIQPPRR